MSLGTQDYSWIHGSQSEVRGQCSSPPGLPNLVISCGIIHLRKRQGKQVLAAKTLFPQMIFRTCHTSKGVTLL